MERADTWRIARVVWPYVGLWALVAAGLVAFARYEIDGHRERTLAAGRAEAENLARVMSEHVGQVFQAIDRTLTLFKVAHETRLAPDALARLGEAMKPLEGSDTERRVNHFDASGRFVASTDPALVSAAISVADRSYFRQARERRDLPLFVGEPIEGRVSRTLVVPVAKRLETADGAFDGVVALGLDPQRLVHLFRALRVGERSAVGIAHRDGNVVAFAQAGERAAPPPRTIAEMVGQEDIVALAVVKGTGLIAFAALPTPRLLQEHEHFAASTMGFAAVTLMALTLPIILVGIRTWHEAHRRRLLEMRYASVEMQLKTDPLTGLANRTAFDEARRLAHESLQAAGGTPFALAFVDVDHFKRLNDTLGHEAGDDALKRIAETLTSAVRQSDVVARLGGDEFAVLMPGVTGTTMHRRFDPIKLDLDAMVARERWPISFSIGVVACETATPRARDAVNLADRVMYDAKESGRDAIRYAVYRDGKLAVEGIGASAA